MSNPARLQLNEAPSKLSLYSRALFAKGVKGTPKLPTTLITLANIKADRETVKRYKEVCSFKHRNNNQLPVTFPHILAFPLHLELMLLKDFPFPLMGMVHIRNEINQYRAINTFEYMDVSCSFSSIRTTQKGYEIDIKTSVHIAGEIIWDSISTNLIRKKNAHLKEEVITSNSKKETSPIEYQYKEFWNLSSDLGRRYALVSGDSNPIHLFSISAKIFGFKGHIAHGMWTKARVVAALENIISNESCRIVVNFKLPIFLPSTIQLSYQPEPSLASQTNQHKSSLLNTSDDKVLFEVKDKEGVKPHIQGYMQTL